jgi:hypothetical protein
MSTTSLALPAAHRDERSFLLQRAQPAMTGLIDGSLSTLTPIFAVALAWIRWRFFSTSFVRSVISIALGGAIIATVSAVLGAVG